MSLAAAEPGWITSSSGVSRMTHPGVHPTGGTAGDADSADSEEQTSSRETHGASTPRLTVRLFLEAHTHVRVLGRQCRVRVGTEQWDDHALRESLILMFEM